MKFNGINHLAMATGDMDATIRFWRDLLGMRLVGGLGEPGYRHYFFEISQTDLIAFFDSIYAFDPNGIPIEFSWTVEGRDIHVDPIMGDSEPTALAKEGAESQ